MSVIEVDKATFEEEVLHSDRPVLLDVYSDWCAPCRMMSSLVELVAEKREDVKVAKLNLLTSARLASSFDVTTIPTLLVFLNGEVVRRAEGLQTKEKILALLDGLTPTQP